MSGFTYLVLVSSLEEATFLNEDEKEYLQDRVEWDGGRREIAEVGALRKRQIWLAFTDTKVRHLRLLSLRAFGSLMHIDAMIRSTGLDPRSGIFWHQRPFL